MNAIFTITKKLEEKLWRHKLFDEKSACQKAANLCEFGKIFGYSFEGVYYK